MRQRRSTRRATPAEQAYIRSLRRKSALTMADEGRATVLRLEDYPEPLRRFLRRERTMVHVKLSAPAKRKLEVRSRKLGVPPDELARRWIEQHLRKTG